jgi:16S rRNA (uracil1498-N3)-methyltransferase
MSDHSHRFLYYSTTLDENARHCTLDGDEHHHASRALRMRAGDVAFVTNGRGLIAQCEVEAMEDRQTLLVITDKRQASAAPPHVTLAVALLKREAFEVVVRQCTELGVTRFVPFVAEKSHLRSYSKNFHERLCKIALAAMKQSFRAVLPVIEPERPFAELPAVIGEHELTLVGDADGARPAAVQVASVAVIVGPEAGLTGAERGLLRDAGAVFVSAVPGRLRSETAATALVTTVRAAAEGGGGVI